MQELSLNLLDIAQNSIKAGATLIEITLFIDNNSERLTMSVKDNGCGMTEDILRRIADPFFTTRTTRKVGLGIPFLKMAAELTGGNLVIESEVGVGTEISAFFSLGHIDMMPIGDMASTISALMQMNPEIDFIYSVKNDADEFVADSREIKEILEGVPISTPSVAVFLREFIEENQKPIL